MIPPSRQTRQGRPCVVCVGLLLLLGGLLLGVTPLTVTAMPVYQSADGPAGDPLGLASVIVQDQSLGVKFHVSKPVVVGSIGGGFAPYPVAVASDILGAIVRLHGPHDFPDSFSLTTPDVLGTTRIHISNVAGDFAGDLARPLPLTGGWYALVFAATGSTDATNAVMPRVYTDLGDPFYFFGTKTGPADDAFVYRDGGDLTGARMFLDADASHLPGPSMLLLTAAVAPVPEPSASLSLLGIGLAALSGFAWWRRRN